MNKNQCGHDSAKHYGRGKCYNCFKVWQYKKYRKNGLIGVKRFSGIHWGKIQRTYGITEDEYNRVLQTQSGVCALCKQPPQIANTVSGFRYLAIDHDHAHCPSGCRKCIRGLLCWKCNSRILPWLEANPHIHNEFIRAYLVNRPFDLLLETPT